MIRGKGAPLRITEFNIPAAFRAGVGRHFRKTGKDIHLSAMRHISADGAPLNSFVSLW
jgi:hypothetical protein